MLAVILVLVVGTIRLVGPTPTPSSRKLPVRFNDSDWKGRLLDTKTSLLASVELEFLNTLGCGNDGKIVTDDKLQSIHQIENAESGPVRVCQPARLLEAV